MTSTFLGEFVGTAVLIYLGNGVVANVLLKGSKGENGGWIVITAGWAFAVTMAIYVSTKFGSPAAHLNPAVTVAEGVKTGDWSNAASFILAQMLGAIVGSTLVWIQYLPHWAITEDKGLKLACHCNAPAVRSVVPNFLAEFLATALLIIVIGSFGSIETGLGPFNVGLLVWAIGLSLGGSTGYAINPARDLGPRIAHAILPIAGKGSSDWSYSWIPVAGPIAGAAVGGLILTMI
ncbi:glycerol uptake facilitator protein [Arcicella aurantiaca]|uniref:Glycerol uptake facilitator protein n=1 Tax=Arcicella aurantiaca TaxID=591202 RepID=A0A316DGI4_9BACT|nr:MIP/aquaporin family protein [Arcicella aurantiaca]PWK16728.1 glycerol uptake facilitator protein [Arcicella aurantiaca]